jgi:hypothetical protein
MGLSFTIAAGPRQGSHSQVRVPRNSWPHLTASDFRLPQPRRPDSRIDILKKQGGLVIYLQEPGSIFVALYDSQGYGGGIQPGLHMGYILTLSVELHLYFDTKLNDNSMLLQSRRTVSDKACL